MPPTSIALPVHRPSEKFEEGQEKSREFTTEGTESTEWLGCFNGRRIDTDFEPESRISIRAGCFWESALLASWGAVRFGLASEEPKEPPPLNSLWFCDRCVHDYFSE
jgi:hypothetical protein